MSEKVPVKIQCAIDGGQVRDIFLIFSNDNGNNWYEVEMTQGPQGYEVVIPNVNIGTRILYCFKAISNDEQEIIEDNRGQYYTQTALATTGTERQEVKKRKDLEIPSAAKEIEKKDKKNIEIKQNLKASKKQKLKTPKIEQPKIGKPQKPRITAPKISSTKEVPRKQKIAEEEKKQEKSKPSYPRIIKTAIKPPKIVSKEESIHEKELVKGSMPEKDSQLPPEFTRDKTSKFEKEVKGEESVEEHSSKTKMIPAGEVEKIQAYQADNTELKQPIVAHNPFNLETGKIVKISQPIKSFSQIIRFKPTSKPKSTPNQNQGKKYANIVKQCPNCMANLSEDWKICGICGEKI